MKRMSAYFLAFSVLLAVICGPVPAIETSAHTVKAFASVTDGDEIPGSGIRKSYPVEAAIRDGCVVVRTKAIDVNEMRYEAYNLQKLDQLIRNADKSVWDQVRVIKYMSEGGKTWINKLCDVRFDGKQFSDTGYDPYTGSGGETYFFHRLARTKQNGCIRYAELAWGDADNMGATLLSVPQASVQSDRQCSNAQSTERLRAGRKISRISGIIY